MNLNNITKNSKKLKTTKKFIQTETSMDGNEEAKVTNTEANAYVIFPEIRKSRNTFRDSNRDKDGKNKTGVSLPAI